jgi:hypothetical protein
MTTEHSDRRDFDAGKEAGQRWIAGPVFDPLSEEQVLALPKNVDRIYNDRGDLVHVDDNADAAADAYAALTGDLECHSRETVRAFWARILPGDLDRYSDDFFLGFLTAVACEVQPAEEHKRPAGSYAAVPGRPLFQRTAALSHQSRRNASFFLTPTATRARLIPR